MVPVEVVSEEQGGETTTYSTTEAFDVLARTLSIAGEARSAGERQRARDALSGVVKQHIAELDELRALCEQKKEEILSEKGKGEDAMET